MKTSIHHVGYGQIEYEENLFTGKKSLTVNGVHLKKQKKNKFEFFYEGEAIECQVKGSFINGARLIIGRDIIELSKPSKWYEFACSISIFVIILIWGNLPVLYSIVPVVGGAVGGALSGFAAFLCLIWMRKIKNVMLKLLAWLLVLIAAFFTCFLIAEVFILFLALLQTSADTLSFRA